MTPTETALVIGCDHAAYILKEKLKAFLIARGVAVEDVGTHSADSVDYPVYGRKVAEMITTGRFARGILLCGTGLGMSMVANRFPGVRAALCHDIFGAIMSRKHNDANILVLGGRVTGETLAEEIVKAWLETPFEDGRHQQRLDLFDRIA
jgi:ribose 5-phosphate isomerase B